MKRFNFTKESYLPIGFPERILGDALVACEILSLHSVDFQTHPDKDGFDYFFALWFESKVGRFLTLPDINISDYFWDLDG